MKAPRIILSLLALLFLLNACYVPGLSEDNGIGTSPSEPSSEETGL